MPVNSTPKHGRIPQDDAFNMTDTVTIAVGSEKKIYTVHSAVLGKSSEFFINAMKPEWRPNSSAIDLTDEDSAIFEIYLHWLYFKTLPTVPKDQGNGDVDAEFRTLSRCYVLGEKFMDMHFKKAVRRAFLVAKAEPLSRDSPSPGIDSVTIIYEGTPEKSPARRLIVHLWDMHAKADWAQLLNEMPSAFKVELFQVLISRKRVPKDRAD